MLRTSFALLAIALLFVRVLTRRALLVAFGAFLAAQVHRDFVGLHCSKPILTITLELEALGLNFGHLLAESGARWEIGESLE